MRKHLIALAALAAPVSAEDKPAPSPQEIVAAAPEADWTAIAASDLLVMDLAPDTRNRPRRVVIQLMPPPFSQGWIGNIRKLASAQWWDGTSVNRVQDNYVVQWGDGEAENKAKAKALPPKLSMVQQSNYTFGPNDSQEVARRRAQMAALAGAEEAIAAVARLGPGPGPEPSKTRSSDPYTKRNLHWSGWPMAIGEFPDDQFWPIHCYAMVGVGRDMPPDTGSGAELYTVIGHAPRHLDRNIALVGRVIEGIEHLSSLPRGTGPLGFYESAEERVAIVSVRLGNEIKADPPLAYEYLSTESKSFAAYAEARANRRDPFFIRPAGGADICNIPVPVRRSSGSR
jgi:peptidylprolyl isomerase